MTADQVDLQLVQLIGRDPHVGQLAEAGIDPVDRLAPRDGAIDPSTTLTQADESVRIEREASCGVPGGRDDVGDGERTTGQHQR